MSVHIKTISDGSIIEFDKGSFDEWCVYLKRNGKPRYAPSDVQYFQELSDFGKVYSHNRIYNDFVKIYSLTDSTISSQILNDITKIARTYIDNSITFDIWFTVIYAGMVAEENKKNAILKKRIKRLGMYQILIEKKSAEYAANFSKGKKWKELDAIMSSLGF